MIDAHCHLSRDAFDDDAHAVHARALHAGVTGMIDAGTTAKRFKRQLELADALPGLSLCHGLHPYFLDDHVLDDTRGIDGPTHDGKPHDDIVRLKQALDRGERRVVGVGECGLDRRLERFDAQWALLEPQLRLAKARSLPVVLHCVGMNDELSKRLKQLDLPARGLVHAFSGSWQQAVRFLDLGYVLGVGGAMTHDGAHRLHRIVKALPADRYVLETDSPDMAPQGITKRNEPANLARVLKAAAVLRGECEASIVTATSNTVRRVFGV
ncbi:TatD family hydrolase [Larsenimonas salina]|uniref:TatD family hydrolase n=1 Tax=Larsenimonas salina TaxID=1295565 RepID=UPI0020739C62|nr:TatD family hydrolase [Larsenimonas salina]MCM5703437.1 TatD family hydrolase [Larsenimonas salina]